MNFPIEKLTALKDKEVTFALRGVGPKIVGKITNINNSDEIVSVTSGNTNWEILIGEISAVGKETGKEKKS